MKAPMRLAAVVLLCLSACASSQPLPRTNEQTDQTQKDHEIADQLRAIHAELRAINQRQADQEKRSTEQQPQQRNNEGVFWPPVWSNWALVLAAVIAAHIAIETLKSIGRQTKANVIEAKATRVAANTSTKSMLLGQRAFFTMDKFTTTSMDFADGRRDHFRVVIEYKNFGQTPAMQTELILGLCRVPRGHPEDFILPAWEARDPQGIRQTVAPGSTVTGTVIVTMEEAKKVEQGDLSIFLYSQARYRDVFFDITPERKSCTCGKLTLQADLMSNGPFRFEAHLQQYNYAD
jgi:hypothetical protein